jgi:hypothetical protein
MKSRDIKYNLLYKKEREIKITVIWHDGQKKISSKANHSNSNGSK